MLRAHLPVFIVMFGTSSVQLCKSYSSHPLIKLSLMKFSLEIPPKEYVEHPLFNEWIRYFHDSGSVISKL